MGDHQRWFVSKFMKYDLSEYDAKLMEYVGIEEKLERIRISAGF